MLIFGEPLSSVHLPIFPGHAKKTFFLPNLESASSATTFDNLGPRSRI